MSLLFEVKDNPKFKKILTWDQIGFNDGSDNAIRKIVLTFEAGEAAHLTVEKYISGDASKQNLDLRGVTKINNNGESVITIESEYYLCDLDDNLSINVIGPMIGPYKSLKTLKNKKARNK